jgi:hypothetical protein
MDRRLFLLSGLAGCASVPNAPVAVKPLTLVDAFAGRSTGRGHFKVWLTGDERRFTAHLNGRVTGKIGARRLTLVEDFLYDDGEKNRLTWVFNETGAGRWTGKREDTVGYAEVIEADGVIRLTYTADFAAPSGVNRLGFSDVIYDAGDHLINDAIVSKSGIAVAGVQFVITR